MAAAHGKWTGEPGVCMATSGPGAIHLLNGLYDAKLDRSPVVAIVGQQAATAMGGSYQQEVDLNSLFNDVCSDYLVTVSKPLQLPMVDRAFRTAKGRMAPTCIIIHADVQEEEYVDPPHEFKMVPGSRGYAKPRITPPDDKLDEAARILNDGERVAILIGQGARGAAGEVKQAADKLGAGVAKALLGKDVLPDTLAYVTGSIGLLGTKPSWDMMIGCDTLLMIGSNLPYSQFLPEWGQAKGVQIDISAHNIGLRYPVDVNLVGDAWPEWPLSSAETPEAETPAPVAAEGESERQQRQHSRPDGWVALEDGATTPSTVARGRKPCGWSYIRRVRVRDLPDGRGARSHGSGRSGVRRCARADADGPEPVQVAGGVSALLGARVGAGPRRTGQQPVRGGHRGGDRIRGRSHRPGGS